jgi:hypothetical protein
MRLLCGTRNVSRASPKGGEISLSAGNITWST